MHPESATSPICINQTIEVNGFNGQPLFCPPLQQYPSFLSLAHVSHIYFNAVMSQLLNRRLTDWERRWAPAHHWSSLIFYQKFRQEVTDYVLISTPIGVTTAVYLPGRSVTTTVPGVLQGSVTSVSSFLPPLLIYSLMSSNLCI